MPIAYFILILIAFIFNRLHFPFVHLIALLGLVVLFADLLTQFIRLVMKRIELSTFLASLALLFVGIGYTFIWLSWPAAKFVAAFGLIFSVGIIVYWLIRNKKPTIRFVITLLITMILGVFVMMKKSSFLCFRNGIDPNNPVAPIYMKHFIAWNYNVEENYDAAMHMLLMEKNYLERRLLEADDEHTTEYYVKVFEEDLLIVNQAVKDLATRNWKYYQPLPREDFQ